MSMLSAAILMLYLKIKAEKILKDLINVEKLIDSALNYVNDNESVQKRIYAVGALLGNGAKAGIGLNTGSGKFKWTDLIGMAAQSFFKDRLPQSAATASSPVQSSPPG